MIEVRDPSLRDFIDIWHRPVDDELAALRRSNESEGVPLILTETESMLRLLLDMRKPERILELGTGDAGDRALDREACLVARDAGTYGHAVTGGEIPLLKIFE